MSKILTINEQKVLQLLYDVNRNPLLSVKEIALKTGITESSTRSALKRLLAKELIFEYVKGEHEFHSMFTKESRKEVFRANRYSISNLGLKPIEQPDYVKESWGYRFEKPKTKKISKEAMLVVKNLDIVWKHILEAIEGLPTNAFFRNKTDIKDKEIIANYLKRAKTKTSNLLFKYKT
jgi:DNA-binding MarR family transcriptional regulator